MRWTPVVILLVAIAIAVIVARGLPEDYSDSSSEIGERAETPTDDAVRAAAPRRESD